MNIIYVLLILLINIIITTECQFMKSEENFDLLVNISKLHFYPNQDTYVLDNPRSRRNKYINQVCKVLSENGPVYIERDEDEGYMSAYNRNRDVSEKNILFLEMDPKGTLLYNTPQKNKYLFYIDLRENYSTCSWKEHLNDIDKDDIWHQLFQSIFLFHYQKNCSIEYEIWIREPWSENPGKKIENIKHAYFNKKPNLHGTGISFLTTNHDRQKVELPEEISLQIFKNFWFEKWNMVNNPYSWRFATILVETSNLESKAGAYRIMSMCFVVQKGKEHPKWEVIIWCFHWKGWVCLTVIWFISGLAWFFIKKNNSLSQSLSEVYSLIATEPISWLPKLNSNLSRLTAGLFMLMSIIINTGFQSNLYKNMQVPMLYPPINEIKQINELNLSIICTTSCRMIFGRGTVQLRADNLFQKMAYHVEPKYLSLAKKPNYTLLYEVFHNSNKALLTSCEYAQSMINSIPMFSKKLHIVEETVSSYPLYYESFPFEKQLHQLLLSYFESGIGPWEARMYQWNKLMTILRKEKKETLIRVFTMDDLQVAFIIIFIGLCISTFVFFFELMSKYWLHY